MKKWFKTIGKRGTRLQPTDSAIVFSNTGIDLYVPSLPNVPMQSSTTAMAVYCLLGNDLEIQARVKAKTIEMVGFVQQKRKEEENGKRPS